MLRRVRVVTSQGERSGWAFLVVMVSLFAGATSASAQNDDWRQRIEKSARHYERMEAYARGRKHLERTGRGNSGDAYQQSLDKMMDDYEAGLERTQAWLREQKAKAALKGWRKKARGCARAVLERRLTYLGHLDDKSSFRLPVDLAWCRREVANYAECERRSVAPKVPVRVANYCFGGTITPKPGFPQRTVEPAVTPQRKTRRTSPRPKHKPALQRFDHLGTLWREPSFSTSAGSARFTKHFGHLVPKAHLEIRHFVHREKHVEAFTLTRAKDLARLDGERLSVAYRIEEARLVLVEVDAKDVVLFEDEVTRHQDEGCPMDQAHGRGWGALVRCMANLVRVFPSESPTGDLVTGDAFLEVLGRPLDDPRIQSLLDHGDFRERRAVEVVAVRGKHSTLTFSHKQVHLRFVDRGGVKVLWMVEFGRTTGRGAKLYPPLGLTYRPYYDALRQAFEPGAWKKRFDTPAPRWRHRFDKKSIEADLGDGRVLQAHFFKRIDSSRKRLGARANRLLFFLADGD